MTVFQGLVDAQGNVIRRRGQFQVEHLPGQHWTIRFPGYDVRTAFTLATPWGPSEDMGATHIAVFVDHPKIDTLGLYLGPGAGGFSFRVET